MKELLGECPRLHPDVYVFSYAGGKPINSWDHDKKKIDALMPPDTPPWRLHDCRRTMRTHLGALPVSSDVAELVIAHRMPTLRRTYDLFAYGPQKLECLRLWGERLLRIVQEA